MLKNANIEGLSNKVIRHAMVTQRGDALNDVLYRLVKRYPRHRDDEEIYAKVVIIGKTYSAALDRNKTHDRDKSNLYWDEVIPAIKEARIDNWLDTLHHYKRVSVQNLPQVLRVHKTLMDALKIGTGQGDRSFASKYLHFHMPHLFFMFDTYASQTLNGLMGRRRSIAQPDSDAKYAAYCGKCLLLRDTIREQYNADMSPRQLDNLLMRERRGVA